MKGVREDRTLAYPFPEDTERIILQYHLETGHGGEETVKYQLTQKYYWREMVK